MVPTVTFPPATPLTCQITAVLVDPVTAALNCVFAPSPRVIEAGVMVTEIPEATVTEADDDLLASACDTAVTVTIAGLGTAAGAV